MLFGTKEPTTIGGLLFVFLGAYLTKVRNFPPGRVSVWEEEERAACGRSAKNLRLRQR